jgi:hypothetical protein
VVLKPRQIVAPPEPALTAWLTGCDPVSMLDERPLDEKLAPQTFVDDFVWAARALIAQPSVALVSVAFWALPLVRTWASRTSPSALFKLAGLAILPLYLGWFGAERVFFLRRLEGKKVSLPDLLESTRSFIGRFLRLGLWVGAAVMPVWVVLFLLLKHFAPAASTPSGTTATRLLGIVTIVVVDVVLTFVPAALVFTTESVREALRIGWAMVRETWPRSALYVVCPPLALNMVNAMYPVHLRAVQFVTLPALALLGLLAKGATVAFYLRERPLKPNVVE